MEGARCLETRGREGTRSPDNEGAGTSSLDSTSCARPGGGLLSFATETRRTVPRCLEVVSLRCLVAPICIRGARLEVLKRIAL